MGEDRRAVLRPNVGSLTIRRRRIVNRPKAVEQVLIADALRIEPDVDGFGVAGAAGAHLLVAWVGRCPATVTGCHFEDSGRTPKLLFDTPKAAGREGSNLGICALVHHPPRTRFCGRRWRPLT